MALSRARKFFYLYFGWIALCAMLFVGLRNAEDPSRPRGRIQNDEAGRRALKILQGRDRQRFAAWSVVQVAHSRKGEVGRASRWIVLCDRNPRTALEQSIVVELDSVSGELVRLRKVVRP